MCNSIDKFIEQMKYLANTMKNISDEQAKGCLYIFNKDQLIKFNKTRARQKEDIYSTEAIKYIHKVNPDIGKLIYSRNLIAGLSLDLVDFIEESYDALKKDKVNVALSLMRKPLKENLFYLEWFLYGDDLIEKIIKGDIYGETLHKLDKKSLEKGEIIDICKNAFELIKDDLDPYINYSKWEPREYFYKLRFDANFKNSLENYWNETIHLVGKNKDVSKNFRIYHKSNLPNFYEIKEYCEIVFYQFIRYIYFIMEKLYTRFCND